MLYTFIAASIVILTSLSGIIFIWKPIHFAMKRNTHYLVTFSIGVFTAIAYMLFVTALVPEVTTLSIVISALLGILFLEFVSKLVSNNHHHHDTTHHHSHNKIDAKRLLISHALRIPIDGLLIYSSFIIDTYVGIAATLGIVLHEIIQNLSQFFVLQEAGYSTSKSILYSFLVSLAILIGIMIGVFASGITSFIPYFIAFASGAFIYVILRDLLPSSIRSIKNERNMLIHLIVGIFGVLVMFSINIIIS